MAQAPGKPLPEQLAKASWISFLLVAAVGYFTNAGRRPETAETTSVIVMIVYALLLLIGLACGVIALLSIRKHGRKGVLVPALLGSILTAGLLCLMTVTFVETYKSTNSQARINKFVASMQRDLPHRDGSETELTRVQAAGGELIFDYTFIHQRAAQINIPVFEKLMRPQIKNAFCEKIEPALKAPVDFRVRYTSADAVQFAQVVVKKSDCGR